MRETDLPTTSSAWPRPRERPIQPSPCPPLSPLRSPMVSDVADARFLNSDEIDEAYNELSATPSVSTDMKLGSDGVESALLNTDKSEEVGNKSVCALDCDESLERNLQLLLQDHSGDIVKKWGNSEQWVLELRDGRRVAVPIQFSLPRCVITEVLDKQNQLALFPLDSSDASISSSALFEEDEVLVEDWVSDSYSEEAVQPLDVEPIVVSLPVTMAEQSPVDVEGSVSVVSSESQEPYSDWLQKRLNSFDSFLGTSLQGGKEPCCLKGSGGKGFRELKGLFSSINYGCTSARRSGVNRSRVLFVAQ